MYLRNVHLFLFKCIYITLNIKLSTSVTLLKLAGRLFPSYSHQPLRSWSKAWTCYPLAHASLPLLLPVHGEVVTLKAPVHSSPLTVSDPLLPRSCSAVFSLFLDMARDHERVQTSHWWIGWNSVNVGLDLLPSSTPRAVGAAFGSGPTLRP